MDNRRLTISKLYQKWAIRAIAAALLVLVAAGNGGDGGQERLVDLPEMQARKPPELQRVQLQTEEALDATTPDRLMRGLLRGPDIRAASGDVVVDQGAELPPYGSAAHGGPDAAVGAIGELIQQATEYWGVERAAEALAIVRFRESSNILVPCKVGASGERGPYQFMPGTWASTPYAHLDPCNLYAATYAAAWMVSQGRRLEWSTWPR